MGSSSEPRERSTTHRSGAKPHIRLRRVTPTDLAALIRAAATDVLSGRGLGADVLPVEIDIARPRNPAHGDYATSLALRTAKRAGVAPLELASWLVDDLSRRAGIATAEVAGPGFVNLRLAAAARGALVGEVLAAGEGYGGAAPALADTLASEPLVAKTLASWLADSVDDSPAYRVRYAHARLASVARQAGDLGMFPGTGYHLLAHPTEGELIRTLGEYPAVVRAAAQPPAPHRVARYLQALVAACHRFEDSCQVLPKGDEPINDLYRARLALCAAARQVLGNGLGLLGVSAPERM